jgi:hypothetical protein
MPIAISERGGRSFSSIRPIKMSLLMVYPDGTAVPIGSGLVL